MSTTRSRTGLAVTQLIGLLMAVIGVAVGFTARTTSQYGGADCGSVLGGGGDELTTTGVGVCSKALAAPTTWTWLLLVLGVLLIAAGWIIDVIQRNQAQSSTSPA